MSVKRIPHDLSNRQSIDVLRGRTLYLGDPTASSHVGKTILPAENFLCPQGEEEFVQACLQARQLYLADRLYLPGRKVADLFVEYVYCTPEGVDLDDDLLRRIEDLAASKLCPYSVHRRGRHKNPGYKSIRIRDPETGKWIRQVRFDTKWRKIDLHFLAAASTQTFPSTATRWVSAGNNKAHELAALDQVDALITALINQHTGGNFFHARQVRQQAHVQRSPSRGRKLHEELAELSEAPTLDNLAELIKRLGHRVVEITKKCVRVIFEHGQDIFTFNLERLLARTRMKRELLKQKTKKEPPKEKKRDKPKVQPAPGPVR